MTTKSTGTCCRTCGHIRPVSDFYESATECTTCKKDRSRQTRLLAARKIALAERVVDMLADLVSAGWRPELCEHSTKKSPAQKQPPADDATALPEASIGPQEVQP